MYLESSILIAALLGALIAIMVGYIVAVLREWNFPILDRLLVMLTQAIGLSVLVICLVSIYEDDLACKAPTFDIRGLSL